MRIFILLLLGIILSGCHLNMAVLTVETEEEFRSLPMLKEFKSSIDVYEFTVDVPVKLVAQRFKHCWSDGQLLNLSQTKVDKEVQISGFKNSYFLTNYNPFNGTKIGGGWELDELSAEKTKVKFYLLGGTEKWYKRHENFAKGISEEDSITYNACKF